MTPSTFLSGSVAGLCRGAERRAEGWSGLQRAGLSGPGHLPGNFTRCLQKIDAMASQIATVSQLSLSSGSKLACKEILRGLPGARQTPALVHLRPPILGALRAAETRHVKGHC